MRYVHIARRFLVASSLIGLLMTPGLALAQNNVIPPWVETPVPPPARAEITVGTTPLDVELATTTSLQSLGLGYRNGLDDGTGMLFDFGVSQDRTFWMKGMRFCLDIVWIEDDKITGAAESVCPDPDGTADADRARFSSPGEVSYVLEVPAGWLDDHGYGEGTPVELP